MTLTGFVEVEVMPVKVAVVLVLAWVIEVSPEPPWLSALAVKDKVDNDATTDKAKTNFFMINSLNVLINLLHTLVGVLRDSLHN